MNRREFIKRSLQLGAALTAAAKLPVLDLVRISRAQDKPEPIVATGKNTNYKNLVIDVMDKLGGMKAFVSPGDVVVVKPNLAWDSTPALGADTHPVVAKTVVELCLDAGAKRVMIFDRTAHDARRAYKSSGVQDAINEIKDSKVELSFVEKHKFVDVKITNGVSLKKWSFYKDALKADKFINVPVAKHHALAKLTIGMKNMMGVIGGNRGDIHRGLDQNLVDINTVVKSDLTIVDATRIMVSNGPAGGSPDYIRVKHELFASPDIVAADSYTAHLFGLKGTNLKYVNIAHSAGMGEKRVDKMKIL